jgi:hypothetical protein
LFSTVATVIRGGEWWDYKLVPILTGFYATALYADVPVSELWSNLTVLLLSLIPGAAFVSVLNDITDVRDDEAAGKLNRMAGLPPALKSAALVTTLAGGAVFFWIWRDEPLLIILYGAAWAAFAFYSVPPVRLKGRGLPGLLADACGAHLFPTLLAAAAALDTAGYVPNVWWLLIVGVWAFGFGARGNAWHQILDREKDIVSGIGTFAARHSSAVIARFASFAFAIEVTALWGITLMMRNPLPVVAALTYAALSRQRIKHWSIRLVIARPQPRYRIWLDDFYCALLPVAILLASALTWQGDFIVLAAHLLLFPHQPMATANDIWSLLVVRTWHQGAAIKNRLLRR